MTMSPQRFINQIFYFFNRQSKSVIFGIALLLVFILGFIDLTTGYEISFSIFYLIPISLTAYFATRRLAVLISFVSMLTWLYADISGHIYSHAIIAYWNALVRLGFFLIVSYTLSAIKSAQLRHEEMTQFIIHDLRAPLTNILMAVKVLTEIEPMTKSPNEANLLNISIVSGKRMLSLIDSLLDIPRLEKGAISLIQDELQPREVVDLAIEQVAIWAQRNGVNLRMEIAAELTSFRADRWLLIRALVNLLSNAIKFSPTKSEVVVKVVPGEDGATKFYVIDQGCGIPAEWRYKVFEKFGQIDARKAGAHVGSGLGLAYCQLVIKAHGGKIWIENSDANGTVVCFIIPQSKR